jgi:hypothetical protein
MKKIQVNEPVIMTEMQFRNSVKVTTQKFYAIFATSISQYIINI